MALSESSMPAEVVLPCTDFDGNLQFFTKEAGFAIDAIFPADNPQVARISGFGLHLCLQKDQVDQPLKLQLRAAEPKSPLCAPGGSTLHFLPASPPVEVPEGHQSLVFSRQGASDAWITGRAGMQYRDLIPDRLGGRFIASHIRILGGGPVPDYAHYHKIRFQMIYCLKGWVKVVYEDQGEPFVLEAGDCVLQPPEIRHRVLESSDGLEVLEVGCPANHETLTDRAIQLPTGRVCPERDFGGQTFLRYQASMDTRDWISWRPGFVCRELGYAPATKDLAAVSVVQPNVPDAAISLNHDHEFMFLYILTGSLTLDDHVLEEGDSFNLPSGSAHQLAASSEDLRFLEIRLPGAPAS